MIWGNIGVADGLDLGLLVSVLGLGLDEGVLGLVLGEDIVLGL